MPKDHRHCPFLAALTLQREIEGWREDKGIRIFVGDDIRENDP